MIDQARFNRIAAAITTLLLAAVACGDAQDGATPSRPEASPAASTPQDDGRRSQPYWVPVTSFSASGNATTKTFSIDDNAIQWRVSWRCESAPFTVVSVNASGKESARKLAHALSCPKEAEGFSAEKGTQSLKVTSGGAWSLDIEQQIDTPLVEPLPSTMSSAQLLATANVRKVDREAEGTAKIYRLADGRSVLRLEDFFVARNSDLEIRLSTAVAPITTDEVAGAVFKVVAPLKATVGSMNYEIPPEVDVGQFSSIVIWCEITRNAYAAANLEPK